MNEESEIPSLIEAVLQADGASDVRNAGPDCAAILASGNAARDR